MRTVQMTLDDDLVKAVDRVSKRLCTSRSAFTRKALREALYRLNLNELERKHNQACTNLLQPVTLETPMFPRAAPSISSGLSKGPLGRIARYTPASKK